MYARAGRPQTATRKGLRRNQNMDHGCLVFTVGPWTLGVVDTRHMKRGDRGMTAPISSLASSPSGSCEIAPHVDDSAQPPWRVARAGPRRSFVATPRFLAS